MELTGKQKRHLKGLGHRQKPLVLVGKDGITDALIRQIDDCLSAHELVKVKALEGCPMPRRELAQALSTATASALVQVLGRTLLIYRPHPESPSIRLPG